MPGTDREVFDSLIPEGQEPVAADYIAYALFAFERREWVLHRLQQTGYPPSDEELQDWVSNLTPFQFQQMQHRASQLFDIAARTYLSDEIKQREKEILRDAIVREIRTAGSLRRQLGMAMLTAVLAPIILGLCVVGALNIEKYLPTILGTRDAAQNGGLQQTKPE